MKRLALILALALPTTAQQITLGTQTKGVLPTSQAGLGINASSATGCVAFVSGAASINTANCTGVPDNLIVRVGSYSGSDPGAKLTNAQAAWSGTTTPITFVMNATGTMTTSPTLRAGADILFPYSITANSGQKVILAGSNHVSCFAGATLTSAGGPFLYSTASNLTIEDCNAVSDGSSSAAFIQTVGSSYVKVARVNSTNGSAFAFNGGNWNQVSDVTITNGNYGVVANGNPNWFSSTNVTCNGVQLCEQIFNADVDPGHGGPNTRAGIMALGGHYAFTNTQAFNAGSAVFISGAHDVVISAGVADTIGDVAYDLEGVVDGSVVGTRCLNAINGCGTNFFYTNNLLYEGNNFSSTLGYPLFATYNVSQATSQSSGIVWNGNTLSCLTVLCPAVFTQAVGDGDFNGNTLINSFIGMSSRGANVKIRNNDLTFTIASGSAFNAISGPDVYGTNAVFKNSIRSVTQPAGSAAISVNKFQNASTQTVSITDNDLRGSGFPIDILTTNSSTNTTAGMITMVSGNYLSANVLTHTVVTSGTADAYATPFNYNNTSSSAYPIFDAAATHVGGTSSGKLVCTADGTNCPTGTGIQSLYANIPATLFALNTMLGPVYFEPSTLASVAAKTWTVRLAGTISCTVAPAISLMDLGTSPTTSYGGASGSVYGITTGTSAGVYASSGSVNMVPGHYYGYAITTGTCATPPTFDINTQLQ